MECEHSMFFNGAYCPVATIFCGPATFYLMAVILKSFWGAIFQSDIRFGFFISKMMMRNPLQRMRWLIPIEWARLTANKATCASPILTFVVFSLAVLAAVALPLSSLITEATEKLFLTATTKLTFKIPGDRDLFSQAYSWAFEVVLVCFKMSNNAFVNHLIFAKPYQIHGY
jgi:hypothetical protein